MAGGTAGENVTSRSSRRGELWPRKMCRSLLVYGYDQNIVLIGIGAPLHNDGQPQGTLAQRIETVKG
ncbi:MAG TPA: hypothetical protein VH395_17990, partial [Jatrophihabitantaceae bacterium]